MNLYELGFLTKCAEYGLSAELSKQLFGEMKDAPFKHDLPIGKNEGFVGKTGFLNRNP